MSIDYDNQKKIDTSYENVPHLYMQMDIPLVINDVILGPKTTGVKEKVAYLRNCTNVKNVSMSTIKYV